MKKIVFLLCVISLMLASFTAGVEYQRGDVDQDGEVGISDVTCLINYLLKGEWPEDVPEEPQPETFTVNDVSFTMVPVKGGTFTMGATPEQGDDIASSEYPTHEVTVSDFCIGQTEVTQALWVAVMGSNPSSFCSFNGYAEDLSRPVENVSWNSCQTFITRLNDLTGKQFRMLTEAEWEFAARGGNKGHGYRYAGSDDVDEVAWYWETIPSHSSGTAGYGTQPVATKLPNELGLYDMSGNVWEWCQDWYGTYSSDPQTDPTGPASGTYRIVRGGHWSGSAGNCRVSNRNRNVPENKWYLIGLRLAL